MRKLCLFAVMAIVLASLGLAGPALAGPHDTYSWFFEDGFDTYTAGELEAGSGIPPVWTTPSAPLGEFVLNTTDTPFNAPNSLRVTTINSDGAAMDATRLIPSAFTIPSGRLLYLHCRIKASGGTRDQNNYSIKLTSGNNAWYGFGVWEATETSIRARVGNSVSGYVPIGSGWRELDIVFDPSIGTKGKSTWYLDGVWFHDLLFSTVGTGAQPDNVFTGIQISDHNYLNAQNGYVMYDDIKAGTDATTLAPVILSPEANCSGQDTYYTFDNLGAELDPTVTWAVDPHTEYQVKVFNVSPNDPNGTTGQVYDSGQLVSGADSHTLTGSTLAEDVTYWLRVRVKINDAWQPWSAAGVDFRVRNLIFDSPDTPVFIAPSPANDGYQRSLSVLPTF
ncbi:MAG: hypothetical protein Q7N50_16000, partial [Armatimonadota bacterium]|nr:hypothetical protein [Armatimonadota bacterium]